MMNSYLIGYDLDKPDQDYKKLEVAIKGYGTWWHNLDSTWIIKSDLSTAQIRDHLSKFIGKSDKLIVILLVRDAAWIGFSKDATDWLQTYL